MTRRARPEQLLAPTLWDGRGGFKQPRGHGGETLCRACNSHTGARYGDDYKQWAEQGALALSGIDPARTEPLFVPFRGRPLRFLKQVVSMFASVNGDDFHQRHRELARFVLEPEEQGLPSGYGVEMRLVRGDLSRSIGFAADINLETRRSVVFSEVAHPPFAFQLVVDARDPYRVCSIDSFANYGADERAEVGVWTCAGHVVSKFPGDYRSRAAIEDDARANSEAQEDSDG
jgi:hypothetical protein